MKRDIITIDETLCTGCGLCIPGCPEGALQLIDGKARLISDLFCDGLGACIGECPTGAIAIETREAEPYDERRVMLESIVPKGRNVIAAHLRHLADHGQIDLLNEATACLAELGLENPLEERASEPTKTTTTMHQHGNHHHPHAGGCPGSRTIDMGLQAAEPATSGNSTAQRGALRQWPIQLHLVSPQAPYYNRSNLLLAADCAAFATGNFHDAFMRGKSLAIACPKLDSNMQVYVDKLVAMIDHAQIDTITVVIMEVPCCGGLVALTRQALEQASRKVPVKKVVISLQGELLSEEWL